MSRSKLSRLAWGLAWLVALTGLGREGAQIWRNHRQLQRLEAQAVEWEVQIRQLANERDPAVAAAAQRTAASPARTRAAIDAERGVQKVLGLIEDLKEVIAQVPDVSIPEMAFLTDDDWITVPTEAKTLKSTTDFRRSLAALRKEAKRHAAQVLCSALWSYIDNTGGSLPQNFTQLARYCQPALPSAVLDRYEVLPTSVRVGRSEIVIREKDALAVDREYDQLVAIGPKVGDLWLPSGWQPSP